MSVIKEQLFISLQASKYNYDSNAKWVFVAKNPDGSNTYFNKADNCCITVKSEKLRGVRSSGSSNHTGDISVLEFIDYKLKPKRTFSTALELFQSFLILEFTNLYNNRNEYNLTDNDILDDLNDILSDVEEHVEYEVFELSDLIQLEKSIPKKIKSLYNENFEVIFDGNFMIDDTIIRKGVSQLFDGIKIDDENFLIELQVHDGKAILSCIMGGDWEHPVSFFVYKNKENNQIEMFAPMKKPENQYNVLTKSAYGNNDDLDYEMEQISRLDIEYESIKEEFLKELFE